MDDHLRWHRSSLIKETVTSLKNNGFHAVSFEDRTSAINFLLEEASTAATIGFGGSMTLTELQLAQRLVQLDKIVLVHGRAELTMIERRGIMQQQLNCDLFFTSTNALTVAGQLVNIDATGNRVCAMAFGPKRVWVVAGANKIVNGLDNALRRVREVAGPPNARRLGFKTPCAYSGRCSDCDSPERICRITTIIERRPRATELGICLINEDLGY